MRTITVERGYDPREFTLRAFGGMGTDDRRALIAAELGIGRILIPRDPGAFSAYGMLVDRRAAGEKPHAHYAGWRRRSAGRARGDFADWKRTRLQDLMAGAFARERMVTPPPSRHALSRPILRGRGARCRACRSAESRRARSRRFHARASAALRSYGADGSGGDRQFSGTRDRIDSEAGGCKAFRDRHACQANPSEKRGRSILTPVRCLRRAGAGVAMHLAPGMRIEGPAVIEEKTSTIVLYPGQRAASGRYYLNIAVNVAGK